MILMVIGFWNAIGPPGLDVPMCWSLLVWLHTNKMEVHTATFAQWHHFYNMNETSIKTNPTSLLKVIASRALHIAFPIVVLEPSHGRNGDHVQRKSVWGNFKWTEHGDPLRSWGNGDDFREMATIYWHVSTFHPPINIMKNGKETWSKIEHILNFHDCWGMTVEPIQKFAENSAHLPFHMRAWGGMGCWTLPCDFKKKKNPSRDSDNLHSKLRNLEPLLGGSLQLLSHPMSVFFRDLSWVNGRCNTKSRGALHDLWIDE